MIQEQTKNIFIIGAKRVGKSGIIRIPKTLLNKLQGHLVNIYIEVIE